jgi:hypothetical protein
MVDTERAYFRYLKELEDRQAARRQYEQQHPEVVNARAIPSLETENPEIGSVSQNPPAQPPKSTPHHSQSPALPPICDEGQPKPTAIYCDLRVERS